MPLWQTHPHCPENSSWMPLLHAHPHRTTGQWPPELFERKSRAPEFYGFVAWTSTYLLFVLYVLWAVLPGVWIEWTGVTWYPSRYVPCHFSSCLWFRWADLNNGENREWALLVPSWSVIVAILTNITYSALTIHATSAFDDMSSITGAYPPRDFVVRPNSSTAFMQIHASPYNQTEMVLHMTSFRLVVVNFWYIYPA